MTVKRHRVGMVASDPLRIVGLQALLEERVEIVALSAPDTLHDDGLSMIILHEGSTSEIFPMIAAFRRARPLLPVLVVGESRDQGYIQKIIAGGARGYLSETARLDEIQMAIEVVKDGSVWAPRKVLARLIDAPIEPQAPPDPVFTPRESEVLELLLAGRSNREIALSLKIDAATVKVHVSRLLQKTGVPNRVALTVRTLRRKAALAPDKQSENF